MKKMKLWMMILTVALCFAAACAAADFEAGRTIQVIAREEGSGTRSAFVELTGVEQKIDGKKIDMTTENAQITNNTAVMLAAVAGDPYAIGYVSLGSLNESVKAVKIEGVEASAQNVADGSYRIARPFIVAYREEAISELGRDFVGYIMSAQGQSVIAENGYVAAADAQAFAGGAAEGKLVIAGSSSVSAVMEKLAEAYQAVNTGVQIEIQTSDSTTGMMAALEGACEIGMASRELKAEESAELTGVTIAMDGIAVIVNLENPADELSVEQTCAIYTGETERWDDV